MSEAKDFYYKVVKPMRGGMNTHGHMTDNYIDELEQQNEQLQKFNVGLADENCKLKEQKDELMAISESYMSLLLSDETISFDNDRDREEGERIWLLLNKYKWE